MNIFVFAGDNQCVAVRTDIFPNGHFSVRDFSRALLSANFWRIPSSTWLRSPRFVLFVIVTVLRSPKGEPTPMASVAGLQGSRWCR